MGMSMARRRKSTNSTFWRWDLQQFLFCWRTRVEIYAFAQNRMKYLFHGTFYRDAALHSTSGHAGGTQNAEYSVCGVWSES